MKILFLFTAVIFVVSAAQATTSQSLLNSFSPNTSQVNFTSTESAKTSKRLELRTSLIYDMSASSLAIYGNTTNEDGTDKLSFVNLALSLGLTDYLEVGFKLPYLADQSIDEGQQSLVLLDSGTSDVQGFLKYNFLRNKKTNMAVLVQVNSPVSDELFYIGEDSGLGVSANFLWEKKFNSDWTGLFNLGYSDRTPGDQAVGFAFFEPIESTVNASLGLSRKINKNHNVSLELLFASHDIEKDNSDRDETALESIVSMRSKLGSLKAVYGFGVGLNDGIAVPEWRAFAGLQASLMLKRKRRASKAAEKLEESAVPDEQIVAIEETSKEGIADSLKELDESASPDQVQKLILNYVEFEFNSAVLEAESLAMVQQISEYLQKTDYQSIQIVGHTDYLGSSIYNEYLSLRRAKAVYDNLIEANLDKSKVTFTGFGERRPLTTDTSASGLQKNRRVEILIKR